jgi:hypothetical protein
MNSDAVPLSTGVIVDPKPDLCIEGSRTVAWFINYNTWPDDPHIIGCTIHIGNYVSKGCGGTKPQAARAILAKKRRGGST